MTDLIENKARQLEHDAKNLEDEDDTSVQVPQSKDIATTKTSAKKPANYNEDKNDKSGPGINSRLVYFSLGIFWLNWSPIIPLVYIISYFSQEAAEKTKRR